jgi:hypothetical protein
VRWWCSRLHPDATACSVLCVVVTVHQG